MSCGRRRLTSLPREPSGSLKMPFGERKIGIKNSSTGHTVEEVIVRRHADLSRSMTRSRIRLDSENHSPSTNRSRLLVHHDGYFPPTGYTVLGNDFSDGINNQQYDHHSRDYDDSSLRSLTNYCQSLRFRVAVCSAQQMKSCSCFP